MDQVVSDDARGHARLERIISAICGGVIFVDASGRMVGMDRTAQSRFDGEMKQFELPLRESSDAVDCLISAETLNIRGISTLVCVIQERQSTEREVMTAMESVLADTSSFARSVIDRLKTLRFASSAPAMQELDVLTDREKEILGLICQGKSDLEMSADLKVSHNTVRNHIASLYRKIGVNRRSAAILWVRERGITAESLRNRRSRRPPSDLQAL
ncbi:response regulator transcription factor [Bradyrhizobium sp. Ce-3]|uniref:response regulator transcription factor n=1 Tax=Bradyrhizobium sp. Ce-3 TaxID=2913970 RepID=UPI001FC7DE6F|nr:LuxR C-terminal-related transcriptional regulator [Bradyrhizobium sp. Ce-3]GKQ53553.1 hypothetical protein BRSPCE3_44080 [Bradyrhizobium sp. Ce-3]